MSHPFDMADADTRLRRDDRETLVARLDRLDRELDVCPVLERTPAPPPVDRACAPRLLAHLELFADAVTTPSEEEK